MLNDDLADSLTSGCGIRRLGSLMYPSRSHVKKAMSWSRVMDVKGGSSGKKVVSLAS